MNGKVYLDKLGREISIGPLAHDRWCAWVRLLTSPHMQKIWRPTKIRPCKDQAEAQRRLDAYCAKHGIPWVTAVVQKGPGFADRINAAIKKATGN